MHYRQGRLLVSLEGTGPIADRVRDELATLATDEGEPDLSLRFVDRLDEVAGAIRLPPFEAGPDAYRTELPGMAYRAARDGARLEVQVQVDDPTGLVCLLPEGFARFLNWNYLSPPDKVAKNFVYAIFDHLCQIAQLPLGQTYLHASAFSKGERGVALVAWGGIGKTTSVLKFVLEGGWQYLGDDLVALDEAGTLWRTPKRMQVYGYNLEGQPALSARLLKPRSTADRLSWTWHLVRGGRKGVRRRVSAADLLGSGAVADSAIATDLIYLQRAEVDEFQCEPLGADALARQAAATLLKELAPLPELLAAAESTGVEGLLPNTQAFLDRTAKVIESGAERARTLLVRIPVQADPDALYEYLNAQL